MNQYIEKRNIFTHAFLMPLVSIVSIIVAYIMVLASLVKLATDPVEYVGGEVADSLSSRYLGVDPGLTNGVETFELIIGLICLLVILTAVVYFIYLWTSVVRDVNIMCQGDPGAAPLMTFIGAYLIGVLVPFGIIYLFYYLYKMQDYIYRNSSRYGITQKWSAAAVLIFAIFIPFVAYALIISSFNEMARGYNASMGFVETPNDNYDGDGFVSDGIGAPAYGMLGSGSQTGTLLCTAGESAGASITMNDGDSVILGRDPKISNIILRNDKKISRRHCTITYRNGNFYVVDYSTNGTKLGNGQKLESGVETSIGKQAVIRLSEQSQFSVQAN